MKYHRVTGGADLTIRNERITLRYMSEQHPRARLTASERRAQLIQVAQRVFASKGVNGTTVEELAHEAGITKPLIYEHFGGKEGLYRQVVAGAKKDLIQRLTDSVNSESTTREKLEQATCALFTFIQDEPDAFRTLIRDAPAPSGGASKVATINELSRRLEYLFGNELEKTSDQESPSSAPARAYAFMMLGNAVLLGEWWLERGQSYDREAMSKAMVNLLWNGISDLDTAPQLLFIDEC